MRIGTLLFALVLAGCYTEPLAPDYALGTYRGTVVGGGSCPSPTAELTVNVAKYSAFGDWYAQRQNLHTQLACAWVNQIGFFSSRRPSQGRLEYVIGYFANDGAALDARIDAGTCSYTGRISRASLIAATANSADADGKQLSDKRHNDRKEQDCGYRASER